ncbi:TPA: IS66 family insertion sequence element accessory protein TnpB [Vibrio parahaemolyticus]
MSVHRSQQEWLRLVQLFYNSEISVAQFCLEHNLHPKTFDNNLRKLKCLVSIPKKTDPLVDSEFITIEAPRNQPSELQSTPLPMVEMTSTPSLRITAGTYQLELPIEMSPHWVAQLLKELTA